MKLSNKVLLGFFGFVFVYLTAAFAELRLTGIPYAIDDRNTIAENVDISGIAYIVIKDIDQHIKIIASDTARLQVRSVSGNLLKRLTYEISGDTLVLSGFQSDGVNPVRIYAFVPDGSLKAISVNRSSAGISGLQQGSLRLAQNFAQVSVDESQMGNLQMELSNRATLSISRSKLDTLSAVVDHSQAHAYSAVRVVQGTIKNDAYLQMNNVSEIHLSKDESSKMHLYP